MLGAGTALRFGPVRIAFVIFKFFPYGGVARDLVKIATLCRQRGHRVCIYAMRWEGERLADIDLVLLAGRGLRSHARQRRFAAGVAEHLARQPADLVVGMNKMPGLDVYYAADSCFEHKARTQRPWAYRLTPRYRHFAEFERAVFAAHGRTRILAIAPDQADIFQAVYGTPSHRFHALPPGIERDRAEAGTDAAALRRTLHIAEGELLLLFIGSGFAKKGLGRVLRGVAALPPAVRQRLRLFVVGADKAMRFRRLARRLKIAERVRFLGGREDVPALLRAADAFVLPAYDEAAGMVILESAIAGLPVLVTANCGYAPYIARAGAGIVTPVPFDQARFNADLERLLTSEERFQWSRRGRELAKDDSLYAMAPCAVELLERFAGGDEPPLVAFCVYEYSPTEPKCRPLVPVAQACRAHGLNVRIYARSWRGASGCEEAAGPSIELVHVPVAAMTPSGRIDRYRRWVAEALRRVPAACVVGFERLPGIDLYYGDERDSQFLPGWRRRHGTRPTSGFRKATKGRPCPVLANGDLPPGLLAGLPPPSATRAKLRTEYGYGTDDVVFVMIGGDLVRHGFERLLVGLGKLPAELRDRCRLLALGLLAERFHAATRVLKLREQVRVFAAGVDCRDAIETADVFVDLAFAPSSNGWLFDALAAGRAVITHDWVQESALVRQAEAGIVLPAPFRQADCNHALVGLVSSPRSRARWQANAARFGTDPSRYGQASQVAEIIEEHARRF